MKILHVNDVASVGSILVSASNGRDGLFQPTLRGDPEGGRLSLRRVAAARAVDVLRLRRIFDSGRYTHLHVHYATFAILAELARLPYSLHVHGGDVLQDLKTQGLKRLLALRGLLQASKVVVSTPDLLEPTHAVRPDAIYVPNPLDLQKETAEHKAQEPRMIVLSKMDPRKGWSSQIELIEKIVKAIPSLSFSFFEHGKLDAKERAMLSERLRALGGRPLDKMSRAEFLKILPSFDFAFGQLEVGSLGMSEMEAMGAAVPTLANVSAHRAFGHEPPVIDPGTALSRLPSLLADAEERKRVGADSRAYVSRVHRPEDALTQLENFL